MNKEAIEVNEVNEVNESVEKVYTFRKLQSTDMFLMFKLLNKLGVKQLIDGLGQDNINNLVQTFFKNRKGATEQSATAQSATVNGVFVDVAAGLSALSGLADVFLMNMSNCGDEVFEMLSNTSNLSVEQVKTLDFVTFTEMVLDFIKKEEFKGFFEVVLKSFKQAN